VCLHGGQVVSWVSADGVENIYLSPQTALGPSAAIRGGIPLCFPQFGKGVDREGNNPGPLPSHGFARNSVWRVTDTDTATSDNDGGGDGSVALTVQLTRDDIAHSPEWDHRFDLRVTYTLTARSLGLRARLAPVTEPLSFCFLFHSYFQVHGTIDTVRVRGLRGLAYRDATQTPNVMRTEERSEIQIAQPMDSVYLDKVAGRSLQLSQGSGSRTLSISSAELPDCVLWNPWADGAEAMADLPDSAYQDFVCVENGQTTPVRLCEGEGWTAGCTFELMTTQIQAGKL
jgi:glucose-6-phosphate 1-epimerase